MKKKSKAVAPFKLSPKMENNFTEIAFHLICVHNRDHGYIYNAEIKFEKRNLIP